MNPSDKLFPNESNLFDIRGFVRTLTEDPNSGFLATPRNFSEQFVIVTTGGSSRAYLYDTNARNWKSVVIS